MALAEAILVCLADEPLSGYDLAKTFDTSIGFFWHADHQQIYRELRKLQECDLVDHDLVVQQGRPNKKLYSITEAGRHRLIEWSSEPTEPPSIKDDMMVKLYGLEHVDTAALRAEIAGRQDHHQRRLALYERINGTVYRDISPRDPQAIGRHLGLELGLAYEQAWIAWCTQALERLSRM